MFPGPGITNTGLNGMSSIKVEKVILNQAGVSELLNRDDVRALVGGLAQDMADQLGEGYEAYTFKGFDRVHGIVRTASDKAAKENMENNTILTAMGGKQG